MMHTETKPNFVRDRLTILGYATIATFAYCLYALGPLLTMLRAEFDISYALMSTHSSLWAIGTVSAGLGFDRLAVYVGRQRLFWLCSAGTAAGAGMFAFGHHVTVTLAAAAVLGTSGALVQTCTFAMLSDRHGDKRDRALVEANIGASAAAVVAPVALGWFANGLGDWHTIMLLPILVLAVLGVLFRHDELPRSTPSSLTGRASSRLSSRGWALCLLVGLVAGAEFCVVFYGASLLTTAAGLDTQTAAALMVVFFAAELVGRVIGSGLTHRSDHTRGLLGWVLVISIAGLLVLWLAHNPALMLIGLSVAGLGIANLFPLALTLALTASPELTDKAAARSQLFVGMAITLGPLVLGVLSDEWGVRRGFTAAIVLAAAALILLLFVGKEATFVGRRRSTK